jgi:hypothetical protein
VTWGEFVETRLLSEVRSSVPVIKLRPLVEWLRERVDRDYPLAYARPFLAPEGADDDHLGPALDHNRESDRIGPVEPLVAKLIQPKSRLLGYRV